MKILITGGAGFIGSHIVDKYIDAGHDVFVIDNLSTGSRENLNQKAKFYEVDIRDYDKIKKIIEKEKPDIINHHAALASVTESAKNPASTFEINTTGTLNLLLAIENIDLKKFIFASTGGALYSFTKNIPADENSTISPASPYGLSKLLAEEVIKFYCNQYKIPFTILRYANVYGPRQNPHGEAGVVAIFTNLIRDGKQPIIFGDGTKTRDYVHVDDIVIANTLALEKGDNKIFNIGLGKEITDQEVFDTIANEFSFTQKPIYKPVREGEILRSSLDSTQAQKILGWKPRITFKEGTKKTIPFYLN